jgi:hypothetical protein
MSNTPQQNANTRDDAEQKLADAHGIRLGWVALYGLTGAGLLGLIGGLIGVTSEVSAGRGPSIGGGIYLAVAVAGFWLLWKAVGQK